MEKKRRRVGEDEGSIPFTLKVSLQKLVAQLLVQGSKFKVQSFIITLNFEP